MSYTPLLAGAFATGLKLDAGEVITRQKELWVWYLALWSLCLFGELFICFCGIGRASAVFSRVGEVLARDVLIQNPDEVLGCIEATAVGVTESASRTILIILCTRYDCTHEGFYTAYTTPSVSR